MGNETSVDPESVGTTISPMLSVRNGREAIAFYERAFGAAELWRIEGNGEKIVAGLAIDGAPFYLADEAPEHYNFSPESLGGSSVRIELIVEDPDSMFQRALKAGAREVWPVGDQHYGWRQGRVEDPYGHHWLIGKPLPDEERYE